MTTFFDPHWWGLLVASVCLSAFVTGLSILYARRHNLVDLPGQRRLHTQPTPRGGGIGIVVAALLFYCGPLLWSSNPISFWGGVALTVPLLLVAIVGWVDDHRPLSARVRIFVQFGAVLTPFIAATLYGFAIEGDHFFYGKSVAHYVLTIGLIATSIVWSINLHNFMDGINGLLASQAIFVFIALGILCYRTPECAMPMFVLAAATFGFLLFNFPRARTFMGDVGSGALGFMIAVAVWMAILAGAEMWPQRPVTLSGVIACSAFVIDASCNLLSRMLRGKHWYSAHREHLYQWMVRSGMSHARVVAWYMSWNLLLVAPVLWWLNPEPSVGFDHGTGIFIERAELASAAGVYALGVALWLFGKRWCLHKVKSRRRHAAA